jgi:CDP-6-deoxy-D-xylo-4-hexulose-3-dehydrase
VDRLEALRPGLQQLIAEGVRENADKVQRYWYPLSVATYDVEEILEAVESMCGFRTTMWEKTRRFEDAFASAFEYEDCIMVNSGSSADLLIAYALVNPSVGLLAPGDEVLVPAVTWPTQIWSALMAGLRVRLVDVDPETLNIDPTDLEAKISERTRGISLVHLMGNPCDMDQVNAVTQKHELVLFEDCCESLDARYDGKPVGSFGVAASFSFFFSHHITTMEGGMVACSGALGETVRLLRAHGWARNARSDTGSAAGVDPRYTFLNWGFNLRPTELQAGFGLVQLQRLPEFQVHRKANAEYFKSLVAPIAELIHIMKTGPKSECSWFALPMVVDEEAPFTRDDLTAALEQSGVETRPVVAGSLARHPVADLFPGLRADPLPGADQVHDRGFYIGLHPMPSRASMERIAETILSFVQAST